MRKKIRVPPWDHNVHNTYTESQICVRLDHFHSSYQFVTTLILCECMTIENATAG